MKSVPRKLCTFTLIACSIFISACGGGGGGGGGGSTPSVPTFTPTPFPTTAAQGCPGFTSSVGISPQSSLRRMPGQATGPRYSDTQLEVLYRQSKLTASGRTPQTLGKLDGVLDAHDIGPVSNDQEIRVLTVEPKKIDALAATLRGDPAVAYAGRVPMRHTLGATIVVPVTPNDPRFADGTQWDMTVMKMPNAWAYTKGSAAINIAVIDTGVDLINQPELAGKITYYETENAGNGTISTSATAVQDCDGHGTNVAGIAAEDTNNNLGFAGVGWNISLQIYKVFPNSANSTASGTDEDKAIIDATAKGVNVINLSLGSDCTSFDPAENSAIQAAIAKGIVVVAASGNEAKNCLDYPAGYSGVLSVGASAVQDGGSGSLTGATEYVASYSNYSNSMTTVAPGGDPSGGATDNDKLHWITNLFSTTALIGGKACTTSPCAALFAGTSQATPHVAGAAALMLSLKPSLTPAQVATYISRDGDNIHDAKAPSGRINVYRTLVDIAGDTPLP